MSKILLLGGGNVLSLVASQLQSDPKLKSDFLITSRRESQVKLFRSAGYQAEVLDISKAENVKNFLTQFKNLEIIVDSVPPIFSSNDSTLEDSLLGVNNLISVLKNYPLKRLIYLSTTGVYGAVNGEVVTEDSPTNPLSIRGLARLKSEEAYQNLPFSVCALRIAGITTHDRNPIASLLAGTYPVIEDGSRYSNRIDITELAKIIIKCLDLKIPLPKAINVSDGKPTRIKDLIEELKAKHNIPTPKSISYQEAKDRGMHTLLSNQQISNQLLVKLFGTQR